MSYSEYLKGLDLYRHRNPGQRYGQAMVNYLHSVSPDLYYQIPREVDPFYCNEKIADFSVWLCEKLG